MRCASTLVLALLGPQIVVAQPGALAILDRATKAYTELKSYRIDVALVSRNSGDDYEQTLKSKLSIAVESPAKFRIEAKGMPGTLLVSDGAQSWNYNTMLKQFTLTSPPVTIALALTSGASSYFAPVSSSQTTRSAKMSGEETLTIQGSPHKCYIVDLEFEKTPTNNLPSTQSSRFWIDNTTYLVLKHILEIHIEQPAGAMVIETTATVEALKVNEPIPSGLFAFVPPAGAKQVDKLEYFPGQKTSALLSKAAPDFRLSDLTGKEYKLSSLRGKLVLLDFWATWCAPCRAEMPAIEKLHKDRPDLIVLGVDVGEDQDLVSKFVTENKISYPILLAGRDRMVDDFDAHTLPTVVVIDAAGIVRAYRTGYGPATEQQLRTAIQDAGKPQVSATGSSTVPQPDRDSYRIGGDVSAPTVLYKMDPEYTEAARKAKLSGTVLLAIVVGADGVPTNMKVVRSLGSGLDEKAIEAVGKWKFKPGRKNGEPVAVQANIEVNFRLLDNAPTHDPALQSEPKTAAEAYRRGTWLLRNQKAADAIVMLDKAVALDPSWPDPFAARGRAQTQQRRFSEAIDDLSEALRLNPKNSAWYDSRGLAYASSGRPARAIEDYNRAIELNPNAPANYYSNRAMAYTQAGDTMKAIADLDQALRIAPDFGPAFQYRADAYAKQKDWQHAIADYSAAIELNPISFLFQRRAEMKKSSGDLTGSEEDLQSAAAFGNKPAMPAMPPSIPILPGDPIDSSLAAPKPIAPNEGAVFETYPRTLYLTWEASPGAASYLVEWDYGSNGGWNSELQKHPGNGHPVNGTTMSFDFVGAQPGRWRVWPVNQRGQRGNPSDWRTFRFTR